VTIALFFGVLVEQLLERYVFYYGLVPANPAARYAEFLVGS
jgi:hypothetical protein